MSLYGISNIRSSNSLSLINSKNGIYNKLSLVVGNDVRDICSVFALKSEIAGITGLAPSTLNTIEKLADVLGDSTDFLLCKYSVKLKNKHR